MISRKRSYDLFLSHLPVDTGIASVVKRAFEEAGMSVFSIADAKAVKQISKVVREAIAESRAVIVIVTQSSIKSPSIMFEVGAASAWNKPIYLLRQAVETKELPHFLRAYRSFPVGDTQSVIKHVSQATSPLSDDEIEALQRSYVQIGIPCDRLALEPAALDKLTSAWKKTTGTDRPAEQLLGELLRLRKARKLQTLNRGRSKKKSDVKTTSS